MPENGNGNGKYPSWKWVLGLALALVAFLGSQGIGSFKDRMNDQERATRKIEAKTQEACDRVTRLEANYDFIIKGIVELKAGQKEVTQALSDHERASRRRGE